jgi:hypothetical protein
MSSILASVSCAKVWDHQFTSSIVCFRVTRVILISDLLVDKSLGSGGFPWLSSMPGREAIAGYLAGD